MKILILLMAMCLVAGCGGGGPVGPYQSISNTESKAKVLEVHSGTRNWALVLEGKNRRYICNVTHAQMLENPIVKGDEVTYRVKNGEMTLKSP